MSRRKALTIEKKAAIIWRLEAGESNTCLARELNMSHSTISSIWKNRESIKKIVESSSNSLSTKKMRSCSQSGIDEALLQWVKIQRSHNVVISGSILRAKANEFGRQFALDDFKCSAGWIRRFRRRHNIAYSKISDEPANVPVGVDEDWLSTVWPNLRKGYSDEQIFNAEETGLFFRLMPDETMMFKGEKGMGDTLSNERLTILVAANMTGSEKLKLAVFGKSKHPRCFENLPVEYESNPKAWMTPDLFEKIIRKWDSVIFNQKNKIILLLDTCRAHQNIEHLKAIKLVFVPPDTTYVLQPMNQGIIKSLKTQYRKLQIMKLLKEIDNVYTSPRKINTLEAILLISQAWDRVARCTISNCFARAGFKSQAEEPIPEEDLSLAEWVRTLTVKGLTTYDDWENFTTVDEDLETGKGGVAEDDILSEIKEEDMEAELNDSDAEACEFATPCLTDALAAVQTIRHYFAVNQESKEMKTQAAISHLEGIIETKFIEHKQNAGQIKFVKTE